MLRRLTTILLTFLGPAVLLAVPLSGAKHETWFEVRSPNFIVVSNAGEKEARKTAIRFEQIRAVFRRSLPYASAHASPTITILAVKDENSMRALLPEDWVKGHAHPAGLFLESMNQYMALVQLDAPGTNPYNTIYHEYYHSLTLPYFPNLPLWLTEGLAEFYGNTQISDSEVGMGRADPDLIAELRQGAFIPLQVLFQVDHSSPYYNEENQTSIFYAESWALTHYLMLGDKGSHRAMLNAYLGALSQGENSEQAAAKGFGDLKHLQDALLSYIERNGFYYAKAPPPPEIPTGDLQVRELSDAEVDAYKGGFAAVRGRTQDAKILLEEAVKLDPKSALAYQYLGFAEYQDHERAEALADFTRAIELNPKNALTRYLRAYLTSQQAGKIGSDQQMEADLREAIADSPDFAPPYGVLAVYLSVQGDNLPEALTMAQKAVAFEPGNSTYQLDLAQVLARMLRYDEARLAALRARANAIAPGQRQRAEQFLALMQQEKNWSPGHSAAPDAATKEQPPAAGSSGGAAPSATDATHTSADAANVHEATGTITKVSCMDGFKFEMTTDAGPLTLQVAPGGRVQIRMTTRPPGAFVPCKMLQGERVTARYSPNADGKTGTLELVTVLSAASGDSSGAENPEGAPRLKIGPNGTDHIIVSSEGTVTQVSCNGNELTLHLELGEHTFILHARDATRVPYEQDVAFDSGNFQACTQLQGHQAKITFAMVSGKSYDGEIQQVEVLK
ncbi:MAG: DUF1570 domain-containing protein [Candidatus Acidiferrales bacterium]